MSDRQSFYQEWNDEVSDSYEATVRTIHEIYAETDQGSITSEQSEYSRFFRVSPPGSSKCATLKKRYHLHILDHGLIWYAKSTPLNRQYESDHKFEKALYFDREYVEHHSRMVEQAAAEC
jgi:hypothetical protein